MTTRKFATFTVAVVLMATIISGCKASNEAVDPAVMTETATAVTVTPSTEESTTDDTDVAVAYIRGSMGENTAVTAVSETSTTPVVTTAPAVTTAPVVTTPAPIKESVKDFPANLKAMADKQGFKSQIAIYDFKTGTSYYYNADTMVYAASIQKLPYAYYCYSLVEAGKTNLTDTKVFEERLRRGGTGIMKTKKSGTPWSIEQLLYYTIQCSDNTGYFMLQDKYGVKDYNTMITNWGFKPTLSSSIHYGRVSAKLIEKSLKAVDAKRGKDANWDKMYKSMCETSYSPFRTALGKDYIVADKIGWSEAAYHDGAIIEKGDMKIALVVLTQSSGSKAGQAYVQAMAKETVKLFEPAK